MPQGLSWPRMLGLLLATVVPSTVAHWAAAGHVSVGAVVVLTVFTAGPVAWLGMRRRPLWLIAAPVVLLQLGWHVGLMQWGEAGSAMGGHHGATMMGTGTPTTWAEVLPDAAGWAMVAAHSAAAVAVLLTVAYAESAALVVVGLLWGGLLAALTAVAAFRVRPAPAPALAPVEWTPLRPLPAVVGGGPLRRGPPQAAAA